MPLHDGHEKRAIDDENRASTLGQTIADQYRAQKSGAQKFQQYLDRWEEHGDKGYEPVEGINRGR